MITLTILGMPQGKGRPRFAKHGNFVNTYTPDKTVIYENLVRTEYTRQFKPLRFADQSLRMEVTAFFPIPKSTSKKNAALMRENKLRPAKKPDADNILKIIADSLNGVAYKDDAQITDATVRRFYSDIPRVEVKISEVTEIEEL